MSRSGARLGAAVVAAVAAVATLAPITARPAAASPVIGCASAGRNDTPDGWAQRMLGADRAWPFTRGTGQRVAVVDSGVDAGQPYLRGHVEAGYDAITGRTGADTDCAGTGTQVAGAIAARPRISTGLAGVAPGARIVPVRVIGEAGSTGGGLPSAGVLARGIGWAAGQHVAVIVVSVAILADDPRVRGAVASALAGGITVVAAAGDRGASGDGNPLPYPAAYPGVIGVSAIDPGGARWASAGRGSFVDLVAPGVGVAALAPGHGWVQVPGSTAIAAGYVAGVAALVRDRWPGLTASGVAARLEGTATPSADGAPYGSGVVNPYAAVTDDMRYAAPAPPPVFRPARPNQAELARRASHVRSRRLAVTATVIGLGVLLLVMLTAIGWPRARRRGWRSAYAPAPPDRIEPDEPPPPALLFDDTAAG